MRSFSASANRKSETFACSSTFLISLASSLSEFGSTLSSIASTCLRLILSFPESASLSSFSPFRLAWLKYSSFTRAKMRAELHRSFLEAFVFPYQAGTMGVNADPV